MYLKVPDGSHFLKQVLVCAYIYLSTPPHKLDVTQGQCLSGLTVLNSEFSFSYTGCICINAYVYVYVSAFVCVCVCACLCVYECAYLCEHFGYVKGDPPPKKQNP